MDHSVEGYLKRQPTQLLELLLQQYRRDPENSHYAQIAQIIESILRQRESQQTAKHPRVIIDPGVQKV